MSFPWELEFLREPHIESDEALVTQHVAVSDLAGPRIAEAAVAATGSLKRFGLPSSVGDETSGETRTPLDWTFQFVAQMPPSKGVCTGNPEFQRKIPVNCQPPRTVSTTFGMSLKKVLPLPKGSPKSQLALIMWRASKSELA